MVIFFVCVALLLAGYFFYGSLMEKIFVIKPQRQTPAYTMSDSVDYVPLPRWKVWLIQVLNIAGTGPIFGPILGAIWGPVAMLWIVVGCIFAGAVHDYFCGMISLRNGGASIPTMSGRYIGRPMKHIINALALILLVLVGVVFVRTPADLLTRLTETVLNSGAGAGAAVGSVSESATGVSTDTLTLIWVCIIFAYYIIATLLPIDKIIGRIYPIFGALLMFMTAGMLFGLIFEGIPAFRTVGLQDGVSLSDFFHNFYPPANPIAKFQPLLYLCGGDFIVYLHQYLDLNHLNKIGVTAAYTMPIWPLIFVTITCGAISGFHATQTPMMARCTENEREARFIFYGAMITEGVIALIWCMVGISFYPEMQALLAATAKSPAPVVYDSAVAMLGKLGGMLAVLGVVVLPITSGDTAFRAARLQLAEFLNDHGVNADQRQLVKRLYITIPLFVIGIALTNINFDVLWRYFSWANQTVATIMLWTAAAYLYRHGKLHWVCTIPAIVMTQICACYLFFNPVIGFGWVWAKIGLGNSVWEASMTCGAIVAAVFTVWFFAAFKPDHAKALSGAAPVLDD
ncbi:carbon starvation protein A [uncultured Cardiobacterium sp.]|uniref:carbon starvation CstA family protein n=1 Tax=uncultured Cardiobacterium sp. TaxID=417619 RepID=UPI0026283AAC|nr:carbon starvation protein A [uncultured Cardiobacterium sp.]